MGSLMSLKLTMLMRQSVVASMRRLRVATTFLRSQATAAALDSCVLPDGGATICDNDPALGAKAACAHSTPEKSVLSRQDDGEGAANPAPPSLSVSGAGSNLTFGDAVERFIDHRARIKNWKGGADGAEAKAYKRTLIRSSLASVPVAAVTTADVLDVLKLMPAVTAEKTRTRIACVLD